MEKSLFAPVPHPWHSFIVPINPGQKICPGLDPKSLPGLFVEAIFALRSIA